MNTDEIIISLFILRSLFGEIVYTENLMRSNGPVRVLRRQNNLKNYLWIIYYLSEQMKSIYIISNDLY